MIQKYEITAVLNGVLHKKSGTLESENGGNKYAAKIICGDLKKRFPYAENLKFYLEGEIIYET